MKPRMFQHVVVRVPFDVMRSPVQAVGIVTDVTDGGKARVFLYPGPVTPQLNLVVAHRSQATDKEGWWDVFVDDSDAPSTPRSATPGRKAA